MFETAVLSIDGTKVEMNSQFSRVDKHLEPCVYPLRFKALFI